MQHVFYRVQYSSSVLSKNTADQFYISSYHVYTPWQHCSCRFYLLIFSLYYCSCRCTTYLSTICGHTRSAQPAAAKPPLYMVFCYRADFDLFVGFENTTSSRRCSTTCWLSLSACLRCRILIGTYQACVKALVRWATAGY